MFYKKGVINMSSISWTASSLSSYFSTSLNTSSAFSGIYSGLSDASLIKSGAYKKLMKSYVSELKKSSSSSSSDSSSTTSSSKSSSTTTSATAYDKTGKSTSSTIKNTVLDELLAHKPYESHTSSTYLDDLLKKNTEDGSIVDKTTESETSTGTSNASELVAGAIIDESV
jgi:hypothetical protein